MTMTRRDYTVIADALAASFNSARTGTDDLLAINRTMSILKSHIAAANSNFDSVRFSGYIANATRCRECDQTFGEHTFNCQMTWV